MADSTSDPFLATSSSAQSDVATESAASTGRPLSTASTDAAHALGWAAYLGASWTWVIGMFLPVLLIRDFGPLAWFIFAIPNVIGAAAMGWVIHSRDHSLTLVVRHRLATQVFSLVTIAFHFFVLVWLLPQLVGITIASIVFGLALIVLVPLLVTTIAQTALAIIALLGSCVLMTMLAGGGSLRWPVNHSGSAFDLVSLASVCVLGFLTCPYLDLTFHRARQACRTNDESKLAFGLGFGVFFCAMIVFTLFYAAVLIAQPTPRVAAMLIGLHISIQAIFTVGIHASSLRASVDTPRKDHRMTLAFWAAVVVPVALAMIAHVLEAKQLQWGRLVSGEMIYRSFLAFYGLIAPAYVWLCVHPGRGFLSPHPRELQMFTLAVIVASPFYWIAFMHGPMQWVLVGVSIVICARFFLDYTRRDHLAEQRAAMPGRER